MSHELRTPLGAVTGYLYLLERTPLNAQQKRYCSSMYTSSEALMELINQILDCSKIEADALTFEAVVFDPTALLHAARRIVETASRGTHKLTLESREGLGSTFRFAMDFALAEPVLEPECERLPEMDEEKTVLLVDDSEINLVMECELLRSFGLQVDTAASAGDALRLAEQHVYDLVLLDIRMPDMDGYELAKRLRRLETYRAVPLLALTADAVGGVRERALDAGMNDCITKPVRPDRLYQVLRRYFALAWMHRKRSSPTTAVCSAASGRLPPWAGTESSLPRCAAGSCGRTAARRSMCGCIWSMTVPRTRVRCCMISSDLRATLGATRCRVPAVCCSTRCITAEWIRCRRLPRCSTAR